MHCTSTSPAAAACCSSHPAILSFLCLVLIFIFTHSSAPAQDTTCSIVWHEPIVLANWYGIPSIAVQGDTVHISWWYGTYRLPYLISTNEGQQWDTMRSLWLPDTGKRQSYSWVVANGSHVFIVWGDRTQSTCLTQIALRASTDRGETCGSKHRYTNPRGIYPFAAVAINDTVCLQTVLEHHPLGHFIMRILYTPDTWSFGSDSTLTQFFTFALNSNALHHATEFTSADILYRKSTNLGTTWRDSIILSTEDDFSGSYPAIGAERSNVYVTLRDGKYGCGTGFGCSILGRGSHDLGTTWGEEQKLTVEPLGSKSNVAIHDNIVAVVWDDELPSDLTRVKTRISVDGGKTWCPVEDFGMGGESRVAISNNAIHIVYSEYQSYKVYYARGEIVTGVKENENDTPVEIELQQNYPNPFNPKTAIGFSLLAISEVTLSVFDIFGKKIATLLNKRMEVGEHQVEWNAEGFPSGLYFYKLSVTDAKGKVFSQTKKMMLMK